MKKAISFSMCVIFMFVFLGGCSKNGKNEEEQKLLRTKLIYASRLRFFEFNEFFPVLEDIVNGKYKDIIFVYSEEEAEGYPDNVFVTCPTKNTEKILIIFNRYGISHEIDITPFSLTYLITMEDVVERWEQVNDFLDSLTNSLRDGLTNPSYVTEEEYEEWKEKGIF